MNKKCLKYEKLFIFNEEELNNHIQNCEDCKKEQETMDKVSNLIAEVKYYYIRKRKNKYLYKVACVLGLLVVLSLTIGFMYNNENLLEVLQYGDILTAEELGIPVDDYGLVMVD